VRRRFRPTNVWMRRDGRWQIVAAHPAFVIDPKQAALLKVRRWSLDDSSARRHAPSPRRRRSDATPANYGEGGTRVASAVRTAANAAVSSLAPVHGRTVAGRHGHSLAIAYDAHKGRYLCGAAVVSLF
jgi:hypothetical protein